MARIVRLTELASPADHSADHLIGVGVGMLDQPDMVNARSLAPLMAGGSFPAGAIEPASRAAVVVFQTWLAAGDSQVLIDLVTGKVMSIDHGDCFGGISLPATTPAPIVTDIPGVDAAVGRDLALVNDAVDRIERVTDRELIDAVSRVPADDRWKSPVDRRRTIACWLAERRDALREVMKSWTSSMP
jgi:hypothetical protein